MLIVEVISTFRRTLQGALDKADIVRMRSLQDQFGRGFRFGRISIDASRFLGPEYPLRAHLHSDEAGATEFLCIG